MTLSHSKGPADRKEKTGDKSIMKFWLVWRTEDSIVGVFYIRKVSSNEVDETGAYYTEWSKPERKIPIQYANAYLWNLERW